MSENSISNTDVLGTEMSRLTVTASECKTGAQHHHQQQQQQQQQLVIQRSGSSSNESPSLSRDASTELYTDFCGVDSQQFLMETLKTNVKSRSFLIGIEKDILSFIRDESKSTYKFPVMNTFNRMLVHRVAAFFGLDHSVEKRTPDCVTVTKCDKTRIPDMKFEEVPVSPEALNHASDNHVVEPKQVLKRSDGKGASFEKSPDRRNNHHHHQNSSGSSSRNDNGMKKSGSYEERQVRYQHARDRIFASQASSSSDGGGDASSGISSNMDVTANSSLKSSQDNVSSKAWSSFESGTVSSSRRLKRQNRVIGSLDSENMTTSSHFLTPDYHSLSQEGPAGTGKKLGVVPKASSFGGVTECSTKGIDLKANDSRLPRNNSFNTTTTENGGSGDTIATASSAAAVARNEAPTPNHPDQNVNNSDDCDQDEDPDRISLSNNYSSANATISPDESNAQSGPASAETSAITSPDADPSSQNTGSSTGILPKPPLIHQSSAPDSSSSGRNAPHQQQHPSYHHTNHRQNSWQTSHHHSFNYHQQYQQSQQPVHQGQAGHRWQNRPDQNPHHYQSAHYTGPRHRYPRSSYNSPAHASGQHYVTASSLSPPGAMPGNPAVGFWSPHTDLRPNNPIHVIMSPKDVQLAHQQQMMIQGMNLIQNSEQIWPRNKQIHSGMFVGQEAAATTAQMTPNHYSTQNHRTSSNGINHQSSGHRSQHESSSNHSHYANQSRGRQNHQQQQPQPPPLTFPAAAGVYYVNPQIQSAPGVPPQPFVMLSPRLPANATYATAQYANPQQTPQPPDSSVSGIPVTMPISYSSIPTASMTGVQQPVAYFVSGVPPGGNAGLLPVPYAAFPSPTAGSVTMPNPFPSAYPAASMNPAVVPVVGQSSAGPSYVKHSPPPPAGQNHPQQQPQQQSQQPTPDTTPPLAPGPANPQYFSGYTICAPPGAMAPPLAVGQFNHMGVGMNPNHVSHYPHQYHQPRSRNPNHNGPKHHYRST